MNAFKLRIDSSGTVRGLWTDAIAWRTLGVLRVRRASRVEFCTRRQMWSVRTALTRSTLRRWLHRVLRRPCGEALYWSPSRTAALAWEQSYYSPGGPGWPGDKACLPES